MSKFSMLTIHLHGLQFFAHHGLYPQEKINGNNFLVDADVTAALGDEINKIDETINYVSLYDIISRRMQQPTPLLETLAQDMAALVGAFDNRIKKVNITIKKLSPPIAHFSGTVGITFTKEF